MKFKVQKRTVEQLVRKWIPRKKGSFQKQGDWLLIDEIIYDWLCREIIVYLLECFVIHNKCIIVSNVFYTDLFKYVKIIKMLVQVTDLHIIIFKIFFKVCKKCIQTHTYSLIYILVICYLSIFIIILWTYRFITQ